MQPKLHCVIWTWFWISNHHLSGNGAYIKGGNEKS